MMFRTRRIRISCLHYFIQTIQLVFNTLDRATFGGLQEKKNYFDYFEKYAASILMLTYRTPQQSFKTLQRVCIYAHPLRSQVLSHFAQLSAYNGKVECKTYSIHLLV
jgi:hypothetical protein